MLRAPRATPPEDPAEIVARAELEQRVARLTLDLPEPYRTTLLMRFHRSLSPKEIAERLGEPAGTVRSRLKRGLDLLRARLDRDHDEGRRGWVLALLPLTGGARRTGGKTMLTAPVKVAVPFVVLGVAGSAVILAGPGGESEPEFRRTDGTRGSVALADGLDPAAAEVASPAGSDAPAEDGAGGKSEKKGTSVLDRKIDVKYEGLSPDLLTWVPHVVASLGAETARIMRRSVPGKRVFR